MPGVLASQDTASPPYSWLGESQEEAREAKLMDAHHRALQPPSNLAACLLPIC